MIPGITCITIHNRPLSTTLPIIFTLLCQCAYSDTACTCMAQLQTQWLLSNLKQYCLILLFHICHSCSLFSRYLLMPVSCYSPYLSFWGKYWCDVVSNFHNQRLHKSTTYCVSNLFPALFSAVYYVSCSTGVRLRTKPNEAHKWTALERTLHHWCGRRNGVRQGEFSGLLFLCACQNGLVSVVS